MMEKVKLAAAQVESGMIVEIIEYGWKVKGQACGTTMHGQARTIWVHSMVHIASNQETDLKWYSLVPARNPEVYMVGRV